MTCPCTASKPAGSGPRRAIAPRRRGLSLRARALAGLLLAAASASAAKADWLDDMGLRGSLGNKSYMRWDGVNFGAHIGVSNMNSDFSNVTSSAVQSVSHNVFIAGQASNQLVDYATFRARAGYAMGQFLPYAFIGAAVGRFNYSSLVSLTDTQTAPGGAISVFTPPPVSTNRSGAIVGGFTTGLGVDVALLPNVFVRGEWEFNAFGQVNGIRSSMNTGRVALGLKF
jgi:outer membrane immunogenic protein